MQLDFQNVSLVALGTALPKNQISSHEIETRLKPLYARLGLVEGRLEALTGIRFRRHFPMGTRPSSIAIAAAEDLLSRCPELRSKIDLLICASVCRDSLEPATAAVVHHRLGLSRECLFFDLSNACLGWVQALSIVANFIESGRSRYALVVSGEDAGPVVAHTIDALNRDLSITRQNLKPSIATLTLGSGGVAGLLSHHAETGAQVRVSVFDSASEFHCLCRGGNEEMVTESETMLEEGVALALSTWSKMRSFSGWVPDQIKAYIPHQVGATHRARIIERLELDPHKLHSMFEELGNTGSASIGIALTDAIRFRTFSSGDKLVLMGIGSGLVCAMVGLEWKSGISV